MQKQGSKFFYLRVLEIVLTKKRNIMQVLLNTFSNRYKANNNVHFRPVAFGINATETAKLSCDIDRYESTMTFFPEYTKFFLENISAVRTKGPKTVVDVGSNQGELARNVRKKFPKMKTINVELISEMNKIARNKDKKLKLDKNVTYRKGNAFKLPVNNNSVDVILFSRVVHEIFSYDSEEFGATKFSLDSVEKAFSEAAKKLKKNGRIIVKDPAKPEDYNKLVVLSGFKDGFAYLDKTAEEIKKADVTKLKGIALLKRFCTDFEPAQGYYFFAGDSCVMPKWLASEFIRHRKFNDTELHWNDELNEQYGVMTNDEYKKLASNLGFRVIKAEHNFKDDKNNYYAIHDDFKIHDLAGMELTQEEDFPVDQYLVLEKK